VKALNSKSALERPMAIMPSKQILICV